MLHELRQLDRRPRTAAIGTPRLQADLRALALRQRDLAAATGSLGRDWPELAAFRIACTSCAATMNQAASCLDAVATWPGAEAHAERAAGLLREIAAALATHAAAAPDVVSPPTEAEDIAASQQPGDRLLAEVRIIRLVQRTINERTASLERSRVARGHRTSTESAELEELAGIQGDLAAVLGAWASRPAPASGRSDEADQGSMSPTGDQDTTGLEGLDQAIERLLLP
jgi:hypothetical protein